MYPSRPLRELPIRLTQVDQVFITGVADSKVGKQLQQHMPDQLVCNIEPQLERLRRVSDDEIVPWPDTNQIIDAVAAIGHPQRFLMTYVIVAMRSMAKAILTIIYSKPTI